MQRRLELLLAQRRAGQQHHEAADQYRAPVDQNDTFAEAMMVFLVSRKIIVKSSNESMFGR